MNKPFTIKVKFCNICLETLDKCTCICPDIEFEIVSIDEEDGISEDGIGNHLQDYVK